MVKTSPVAVEPAAKTVPRERRWPRQRLLIGGGALVVLIAAIAAALLSGGSGKNSAATTQATTTVSKPKPAPTRYAELLPTGMSMQQVVAPVCASYRKVIATWQAAGQRRLAATRGVSTSDPYAAWSFVHKRGMGWLNAQTEQVFVDAIEAPATKRLRALAGAKGHYVTDTIEARFNRDALYLCHETRAWKQTDTSLSKLDTRTDALVSAAASKPWYPKGYNEWPDDPTIAVEWDNHVSGCQDAYSISGEYCWGMRIISQNGCSSSIYAEISILQGQTVIDYSNDTLPGLDPHQVGELAFQAFENSSGNLQGQLKEIDCY